MVKYPFTINIESFDKCGNGLLSPTMFEECDDENNRNSDGWNSRWEKEEGFICINDPLPSYCYKDIWGDTKKTPGEEWEDNNNVDDDGWTNCTIDRGYSWEGGDRDHPDSSCEIICGDGILFQGDPKIWDDNNTVR